MIACCLTTVPRLNHARSIPSSPPFFLTSLSRIRPHMEDLNVIDAQQRAWQPARLIGQGSWAKTWLVTTESGEHAVLKVPYQVSDLGGGVAAEQRATLCVQRARQLGLFLRTCPAWAPDLLDTPTVNGLPTLLMRYYPTTLLDRLNSGAPFSDILRITSRVARLLSEIGQVHGALHPANILIDDEGTPFLDDPMTAAACQMEKSVTGKRYAAPEESSSGTWIGDTWGLCAGLYQSAMVPPDALRDQPIEFLVPVPSRGLDKIALATLRERIVTRMKNENSNLRFRNRLSERLASLLNRALSAERAPSPPYRFEDPSELCKRLDAVASLVDPAVTDIGRLMLASTADNRVFQSDRPVGFAVTIGCSPGIESPEDVACGLALTDLDAAEGARRPVPGSHYEVRRHPSGRLRFGFTLPEIPPGRYSIRVAFSIKDSGHMPVTTEGPFEVRPPAGWVPPVEELTPEPLTLPKPMPSPRASHAPTEAVLEDDGPRVVSFDPAPAARTENPMASLPQPVAPPSDSGDAIARYGDTEDAVPTVSVVPNPSEPHTSYPSSVAASLPEESADSNVATAPKASGVSAEALPWSIGQDGDWEDDLPSPQMSIGGASLPHIPGAHEDLDQWNPGRSTFDLAKLLAPLQGNLKYLNVAKEGIEKAYDYIRRDFYTSLVASIGTSLILVWGALAMLKACGG